MSRAESARDILAIPLFNEILKDLEQSAVDKAVNAKYADHEARQSSMADVRAIRNLKAQIEVLSKEDQSTPVKKAPA